MPPIHQEKIARTGRIFEALKDVSFAEYPAIDVQERLSLLTVPAGVRPVAVLGVAQPKEYEGFLVRLKDILGNFGLHSLFAKPIPATYEGSALPHEVNEIFREHSSRSDAQYSPLLWVYQTPQIRRDVRAVEKCEVEAGILLDYPKCCVAEDKARKLRGHDIFAKAIIQKVGDAPDAVRQALEADLGVEVDDEAFDTTNAKRTAEQFPFVFHIACETCLQTPGSSTAVLDNEYRSLAKAIDRDFFEAILAVRPK